MFILSNFIYLHWQSWLLFQNNNQFIEKSSLQLHCDNFSCVLAWALIIFISIITFILTSKNDECDNHNFNFYSCWKISNMNYLHKIFLSHSALFEHHYLNEKISILINKKCLFINFFFVSIVSDFEIFFAFRHVILVENKIKITFKLNFMFIRSDI